MANLDKIMRIAAGLIAKSDSSRALGFDAEAETYAAKAQELIIRYRIEEEQLIMEDGTILPVRRMIPYTTYNSEFRHEHGWLWAAIARHCGVRYVTQWNRDTREWEADTVGYDVDIRLAELLYNSARLVFGAHLEPEVDPKLSDRDNVYRLRSAGIERNKIAQKMWGADLGKSGHSAHAKVGRLYAEACAERGEDATVSGRRVSAKTYREVYAREFVTAVERRLRLARDAADAAVGALVSVDRAARVEEAFYTAYPSYRPQTQEEDPAESKAVKVTKARKPRAISKATEARWDRLYYGPTATAARRAAKRAAEDVELQRPTSANRAEAPRRGGVLEG